MANNSITMNEETKKFQEAVKVYFEYNGSHFNTQGKGYLLLLLLYLIKNDAIKFINSKKLTNAELSKLKVLFCYPFKNLKEIEISEELENLYSCDCCVINFHDKEKEILEIADGLGIKLDYDFQQKYSDINIVSTLFSLALISLKWYKENSSWAFNEICSKLSYGNEDIFILSKELRSLLVKLLDAQSGDIYYPYANWDIIEFIKANGISEDIMSFIHTNKKETYFLIKLALLYNDISVPYTITNSSSITDWRGDIGFDYIFATPPWIRGFFSHKDATVELDFLARSSRDVLHKSIGIYPLSICFSRYSKVLIKELLEKDWIEKVISLPEKLSTYTGTETVIIVVNKDKLRKGEVCFVDATKCFIKDRLLNILDIDKVFTKLEKEDDDVKWVSSLDIVVKGETIYPKYHTIFKRNNHKEGEYVVELSDIVEQVKHSRHSEKFGRLVRRKNLNKTLLECLSTSNNYQITNDLSDTVKVEEPIILSSGLGYPTFYIASPDNPLFVCKSIRTYKVIKPWVFPEYLCYELGKSIDIVKKEFPQGFTTEILLRFKIAFPSENIEEQKRIVKEATYQLKLSQAKELDLQEVIERMKADYINEVRNRKHEMGPYIATLTDIHEDLMNFRFQEKCPEYYNEFNYQCGRFERALNGLKSLVSILSDEIESSDVIDLNINDYFTSLVKRHDSKYEGYNLIYNLDIDKNDLGYENLKESDIPFYTEIAKAHFDSLINNIIQNAKRHGFVDSGNKNYTLEIRLSLNSEDSMFQIDFINNGNPLPKGMDKKHYGILGEKAGKTANNGEGGYRVKSIVTLYNGDYDVFMDNYNTVIRILLPISKNKYEQDV